MSDWPKWKIKAHARAVPSDPEPEIVLGHLSKDDINATASATGAFTNPDIDFELVDED